MKAFSRHDINGINNFTGQYFTFGCTTDQISSNPSKNTVILHNFASNNSIDNNV